MKIVHLLACVATCGVIGMLLAFSAGLHWGTPRFENWIENAMVLGLLVYWFTDWD
jgi:uncharacterized YccA/Bax inhibitor family protein